MQKKKRWEKNDSNLRIPIFDSPGKVFENVPPKVSSMDFVNHKPGFNIMFKFYYLLTFIL